MTSINLPALGEVTVDESKRVVYFKEKPDQTEKLDFLFAPSPSSAPYWFGILGTEDCHAESFPMYRQDDSLILVEPNVIFVETSETLQSTVESYLATTFSITNLPHPTYILSKQRGRIWAVMYIPFTEPAKIMNITEGIQKAHQDTRARVSLRFTDESCF